MSILTRTAFVLGLALLTLAIVSMGALAADTESRDQQKSKTSAPTLNKDLNADDPVSVASASAAEVESIGDGQKMRKADGTTGDMITRRGRQSRRNETVDPTGESDGDDGSEKTCIVCHKQEQGAGEGKTLVLPETACKGHLGHNDKPGPCPGDVTPTAP